MLGIQNIKKTEILQEVNNYLSHRILDSFREYAKCKSKTISFFYALGRSTELTNLLLII